MIKYQANVNIKELDRKVQNALSVLKRAIDVEIIATSGLRTPEHNAEVGGSPTSSHLKGLAIDFACTDSKIRYKIIFAAVVAGFRRIGIAKDHIHLDMDAEKPQPIIFFD